MRFSYLLFALPALTIAQLFASELDSIFADAPDLLTQIGVESALSAVSSLANNPLFISALASLTSEIAPELASITSQYGPELASYAFALDSLASDAAATASAAGASADSIDRVVIPGMAMVGAAILGLAAFL